MPTNLFQMMEKDTGPAEKKPTNLLEMVSGEEKKPTNLLEQVAQADLDTSAVLSDTPQRSVWDTLVNVFTPDIIQTARATKALRETKDKGKLAEEMVGRQAEDILTVTDIPFQAVRGYTTGMTFGLPELLTSDWTPDYRGKEFIWKSRGSSQSNCIHKGNPSLQ